LVFLLRRFQESIELQFIERATNQETAIMASDVKGSVLVVGGGIAGMQSALDLANSGYYVYLLEKSPSIGGVMSQLDKTFPTNDCAM
jgi:heterodisulfide reductase subunit A